MANSQNGAAQSAISVRMHRGILGDCFLITHKVGTQTFKTLVDCGVLQCIGRADDKPSTKSGADHIRLIAEDLMAEIGGELDLMIATHAHYDHLSGFLLANTVFKDIVIRKLWVAWTENRADPQAKALGDGTYMALQSLTAFAGQAAFAAAPAAETVRNLLAFYGDVNPGDDQAFGVSDGGSKLRGNSSCDAVIEWLKDKAGPSNVSYLEPGEVRRFGIGDVLKANVLGPPRTLTRLKQLDPSNGDGREVYMSRRDDISALDSLLRLHGDKDENPAGEEDQPFSTLYRVPYPADKTPDFPTVALYEADTKGKENEYKRIDGEWMDTAENLALKIDGDVNNTSLALAIEVRDGGDVLLFPGDAQVGNWLSWGDQAYGETRADGSKGPAQTLDTLLSRVILYKVGHHASHNATLKARGLELMTDRRLCAMIPVVEKTAREQKTSNTPGGWAMPYGDLYQRLKAKTQGRILRGDGNCDDETAAFKSDGTFRLSYAEKTFPPGGADIATGPLWAELSLDL